MNSFPQIGMTPALHLLPSPCGAGFPACGSALRLWGAVW